MPIYEYECSKCGATCEVMQKITDEPAMTCKGCGSKMNRLISQTSFILKGSGWYVTDYARKQGDAKTKRDGASAEGVAGGEKDAQGKAAKGAAKEPKGSEKKPAASKD